MPSAWFDNAVAWISAHPVAAGGLIFLIAFCDALAVVGIAVPALPLLFAVGALVGLGHVSGPYAIACAALGALLGDALSFWIGRRWGPHLREHWPFRRYPQLLDRGEALFRRHGSKGIVIARYVGAVRPFVPAVAGMLRMPLRRYLPASAFAALTWAAAFLAPGWLFGASYDAVAAVADRLALVLLALLAVLALAWAAVLYTWRWFADRADALLARALRWSRSHPRLGRYAVALIDPNRPESASLALLAACLLAIGWAWFALLAVVLARGGPLLLDRNVHAAMLALRNPLADRLMAALASLGDAAVLLPACVLVLGWLLWRRRFIAAAYWLGALAFGLALTAWLGAVVEMPRPPTAPAGFGFPSIAVTMATIVFGFFAVLVARALPGRRRVWPYLIGGALVAMLGFARLYLGAHWLSDVVGGILLGIAWLLLLGLAYRRHVARALWMRPLAGLFYGAVAAAALWHAPRAVDPLLAWFHAPVPGLVLDAAAWWDADAWRALPAQRNERDPSRRWPLDVQVAGPLAPLRARLLAQGWREQPQADWVATLGLLDEDRDPARQPVLPATLDAEAEALLLRRPGAQADEIQVLRLWPAPALLDDGTPLWLGGTQTLRYARPFDAFGLWRPQADDGRAHAQLREALAGLPLRESAPADAGTAVLRVNLRTAPADASGRRPPAPRTQESKRGHPATPRG
ncbi:bifunctional DedA family/phosphatase PAP2 family protein [Cognatiluteimonas weifangensis]|uniref:Phosphatase PAP2 family protein n=1 Tax=Cognatiluteimonas weifangensis TaxID=2303539 RepID=A0A372DR36_9GAMM|nr:bifunctional DedA family/phosphatase PAP2 family protein [Luteimonas weifangensis]RFP61944.1 phosphatase PAP2 family protein [Luteimonas weifangensis]